MTAVAVRATGRHHAPGLLRRIKLRLMDHNDRMLRDMARDLAEQAEVKANAGRVARSSVACIALAVLTACLAGDIPPLNTTITAVVLGAALLLTGVVL